MKPGLLTRGPKEYQLSTAGPASKWSGCGPSMATSINHWNCTVASEDLQLLLIRFIVENPRSHTAVLTGSKSFPENVIAQDQAQEVSHRIFYSAAPGDYDQGVMPMPLCGLIGIIHYAKSTSSLEQRSFYLLHFAAL